MEIPRSDLRRNLHEVVTTPSLLHVQLKVDDGQLNCLTLLLVQRQRPRWRDYTLFFLVIIINIYNNKEGQVTRRDK